MAAAEWSFCFEGRILVPKERNKKRAMLKEGYSPEGGREMAYRTLYRAWRPQTFDQVLGQDHVCRTLKNAISNGRLAHAYLFCGPRGTGKTSTAKILAKALNCEHGPTPQPCDECSLCVRIREGYCLDVLEMDAASNRGIDEIRSLRDQVRLTPTEARYKVYIIDEVHMLTAEAFNAFLKTLEEPPPRVVFILATTEPERIPATILSRCQRFDFHRLTAETIAQRLEEVAVAEELTLEPRTAMLLARSAEGSLRDGLGLLDQCISFCGSTIGHQDVLELLGVPAGEALTCLLGAIGQGEAGSVLTMLADLRTQGKDPRLLLKHLTFWLRNLLLIKVCREPEPLLALSKEEIAGLRDEAKHWRFDRIAAALTTLTEQENVIRLAAQPWIVLEAALVGLCLPGSSVVLDKETIAHEIPVAVSQGQVGKAVATKTVLPQQPTMEPAKMAGNTVTTGPLSAAADDTALENIRAVWGRVLEEVKTKGPALEAVWRYGQPQAVQDNVLLVVFEAEGIKNVAAQPDKTAALEEALYKVLKTELKVRPETAVAAAEVKAAATKALPPEAPGIVEARALFGADKVIVRKESEE